MGLWDKLRGEFIDIIEWTEPSQNDILAYRFPRYNNEIKNGAKLIVREGQIGVFIKEGQIADVKTPGMYTLDSNNMPILSTILGWKYGFESPFKCEVYFIATRQWTDQKWGTANPIMMRDAEFGMVRIRAFGSYAFRVSNPMKFITELVATDPSFETWEISNQLRSIVISRFIDVLGKSKIPVLDLAGNYGQFGSQAKAVIGQEMLDSMGLELTQFLIENISLPPEVEAIMDKRTSMGVLGDLNQYTRFQTAEAIGDAAKNPGMGGVGPAIGAGVAMGNVISSTVGNAMQQPPPQPSAPPSAPPPMPQAVQFFAGIDGAQAGPFDPAALAAKIRDGSISRSTLVWKQGMADWAAADTIPELQGYFASIPPMFPPSS